MFNTAVTAMSLEGVSSPRGVRRRPPPWRGHTPGGEDVVLPAWCVAAKPLYGIPHTVRGGGSPPRAVCELPDVDCTFICMSVHIMLISLHLYGNSMAAAAAAHRAGRTHPPGRVCLCARCAETNFPAGINQGQEAAPPLPPLYCLCVPWFN